MRRYVFADDHIFFNLVFKYAQLHQNNKRRPNIIDRLSIFISYYFFSYI
nr:MAG TPA: hypothetical protein [Caudoviricetes sp.]